MRTIDALKKVSVFSCPDVAIHRLPITYLTGNDLIVYHLSPPPACL